MTTYLAWVRRRSIAACAALMLAAGVGVACAGSGQTGGGVTPPDGGQEAQVPEAGSPPHDASQACDPSTPPHCDPNGGAVVTCASDGSGWLTTPCEGGACVGGQCAACPPGTVLSSGQCDDIRCPDELPSSMPSSTGLPTNTDAWPRFRHDNRNSGWTRAKVAAMPQVKWSKAIGFGVGPALDPQGHIFAGAETANAAQGYFDSFDTSGNMLWTLLLGGMNVWDVTTPAVLVNGTSYLSTDNNGTGELWAIAPNGTTTWTYPVPSVAEASPIVSHDGTLVYSNDDHFYGLDSGGHLLWETDPSALPGSALGSNAGLAETCDGHIYGGTPKGWRAIDVTTGNQLWLVPGGWTSPTLGATASAPVVAADGTLYALDSEGVAWAVDAGGNVLWRKALASAYGERISSAKLGDLLLGLSFGKLVALDAHTGDTVWMAGSGFGAGPVIDGNMRIYVNDGRTVFAYDRAGKSLWTLPLGTGNSGPGEIAIAPDGTMYVQTFDSGSQKGYLWAIQ